MDTGEALLAAICADPEEDTPRLVYADWLDERSEPGDADRAAFIRLQCEIEQICSGCSCDPCMIRRLGPETYGQGGPEPQMRWDRDWEHLSLYRKERRLFENMFRKHQVGWLQIGIPPAIMPYQEPGNTNFSHLEPHLIIDNHSSIRLRVRRGFVNGLHLTWRQWNNWCDRITATHPIQAVAFAEQQGFASGPRFTTIDDQANLAVRVILEEETCDRKRRTMQHTIARSELMMSRINTMELLQIVYHQVIGQFLKGNWPKITFQVPHRNHPVPPENVRRIAMGGVTIDEAPIPMVRPGSPYRR